MKKYAFAAAWLLSLGLAVSACDDKKEGKEGNKASDTKSDDKGGDDIKATCLKMCKKAGECVPEIAKGLTAEMANLLGKEEAEKQQADMEKKMKAEFGDCDKMCSEPVPDKAKEAEEAKKMNVCLEKKDCKAFFDCMEKTMSDEDKKKK